MSATTEIIKPMGQIADAADIMRASIEAQHELRDRVGSDEHGDALNEGRWNTEVFALSSQIYVRAAIVERENDDPKSSTS